MDASWCRGQRWRFWCSPPSDVRKTCQPPTERCWILLAGAATSRTMCLKVNIPRNDLSVTVAGDQDANPVRVRRLDRDDEGSRAAWT